MLAVETVSSSYYGPDDAGPVGEMLERALRSANQAIHGTASDDSAMTGMGTTCTAAVFQSGRLHLAHVGDSRAYLIDRHGIRRLTQDHTLAVELERLAPDSGMATSTARNVLTRCLGNDVDVEVDLLDEPLALMPGQFVLLCSDGLSSLVEDEEILARCRTGAPGEVCRTLADLARARGGPDNITVVMAEVRTNHGA
jgi:protein phosphatase